MLTSTAWPQGAAWLSDLDHLAGVMTATAKEGGKTSKLGELRATYAKAGSRWTLVVDQGLVLPPARRGAVSAHARLHAEQIHRDLGARTRALLVEAAKLSGLAAHGLVVTVDLEIYPNKTQGSILIGPPNFNSGSLRASHAPRSIDAGWSLTDAAQDMLDRIDTLCALAPSPTAPAWAVFRHAGTPGHPRLDAVCAPLRADTAEAARTLTPILQMSRIREIHALVAFQAQPDAVLPLPRPVLFDR